MSYQPLERLEPRDEPKCRGGCVRVAVAAVLVAVLLGATYGLSYGAVHYGLFGFNRPQSQLKMNELRCMMPMGRAHVDTYALECLNLMRQYSHSGQYLRDVAVAVRDADTYFDAMDPLPNCQSAVVFDIDETLVSNLAVILCDNFHYNSSDWSAFSADAAAPALQPSLDLYTALFRKGYSLVLITGRSEADRDNTERNLRNAGFGGPCSEHMCGSGALCYRELAVRNSSEMGIPASVYKPGRRAGLLQRGLSIAGLVGDQWSDLSGAAGPTDPAAVFKMPNPFYYIN